MNSQGLAKTAGTTKFRVIPRWPTHKLSLREIVRFGFPNKSQSLDVNWWRLKNLPNLLRGLIPLMIVRLCGFSHQYGQLFLVKISGDGLQTPYGLASLLVVTTAGVNFIAARMSNVSPSDISLFNFHGLGTGTNAEAVGDTALQTELTTQYNPNNTRATGTQSTPGSSNIYRTVGTNTVDAAAAVTEHGILTQSATGGGTLLDRSVFSVINLANGDSLQSTYDFTISSGG